MAGISCGSALSDGEGTSGDRGDLGGVLLLSALTPSSEEDQRVWRVCWLGLTSEQTLADTVPTRENKISQCLVLTNCMVEKFQSHE